jgi:hypothetical protein
MVHVGIVTLTPTDIDVVLRFKSAPDVPTVPSMTCVPPEVATRNHVAEQDATPATPLDILDVIVGDSTALDAEGANGLPRVKTAATVVADPPVAG